MLPSPKVPGWTPQRCRLSRATRTGRPASKARRTSTPPRGKGFLSFRQRKVTFFSFRNNPPDYDNGYGPRPGSGSTRPTYNNDGAERPYPNYDAEPPAPEDLPQYPEDPSGPGQDGGERKALPDTRPKLTYFLLLNRRTASGGKGRPPAAGGVRRGLLRPRLQHPQAAPGGRPGQAENLL